MATLFEVLFKANTSELEKANEKVKETAKATDAASEGAENLGKAFGAMGGPVGEAAEKMEKYHSTITKMLESVEKFASLNVNSIMGLGLLGGALVAATLAAAAFAVALGAVGIAMAFEAFEKIEQMDDLGKMFGYTASQTDLMSEAAQRAGGSLQAVEMVYQKVAKAAWAANDPIKGTGAAFAALGIDVKDANGQLKSSQDITEEAIKKWNDGSKTTEDMAAMTAVLGKSWQQNLPIIEATIEANKLANELQQKGIGMSKEATDAVEKKTQADLRMHGIMADVGSKLVELVIPAFTTLTNWMSKSYETGGLVAGVFGLVEAATWTLMAALRGLMGIFATIDGVMTIIGKAFGALGASMVLLAQGELKQAGQVWKDWGSDTTAEIDKVKAAWVELIDQQINPGGHTIEKIKKGNAGNEGGDQKDLSGRILGAAGKENDPYEKYLDTLNKAMGMAQHLNQEQMTGIELEKLKVEYAKQKDAIDTHNAEVQRTGKGQLKDYADLDTIQKEIVLIKEKAKAIDDSKASYELNVAFAKQLNDAEAKYNLTIDDEIRHKRMSVEAIKEENQIRQIEKDLLDEITKLKAENLWTQTREDEARAKSTKAIDAAHASTQRLIDANKDWLNNGVNSFITSLGTMEQGLEKVTTKGLQGFSDNLYSLITTGKSGFKGLISSMLDDIAKLIFQLTVVTPMINAMKSSMGGGGGGFGGFLSMLGIGGGGGSTSAGGDISQSAYSTLMNMGGSYANGGVFGAGAITAMAGGGVLPGPTLAPMALMGEAGPEAVVPLSRSSQTGKLGISMQGSGGGSANVSNSNVYNINVTGANDPTSTARQIQEQIKQIQMVADQRLAVQLKPGGMLNRASAMAF